MNEPLDIFLEKLANAFDQNNFIKCTLSRPTDAVPDGLKNVFLRPVEIKKQPKISATFRFKTRDEMKNFSKNEILENLKSWLPDHFLNGDLFSTAEDLTLFFEKTADKNLDKIFYPKLISKKPQNAAAPNLQHNREKIRLLDPAAPWLRELGITNLKGEVLPTAQDKWRQINKFLEIIDSLVSQIPDYPITPHLADMGSGKGYLTFALFDFLKNKKGFLPKITGIELRRNLVDFCNQTAQKVGFQGLEFVAADISAFQPPQLDMLIALHACDTATDLAIAAGLRCGARAIVVAPCCHKQIRREMHTQNELAPAMRHGILLERQAEILTDSIRALLLESEGYRTSVFEFVSTEHTAKNVMITAVAAPGAAKSDALKQVAELKKGFGIGTHFLEKLLEKENR